MISIEIFKKLALSFEASEEQAHFEKISFRVKKKIFATLDSKNLTAVVKLTEMEQSVFSTFDKEAVYTVNGAWGKQGWTTIELAKTDKEIVIDVLTASYCNVAPKKLSEQYQLNGKEEHTKSTERMCKKGHIYYKSSDCPTCPTCEKERKPKDGFMSRLSAPARRALENQGILSEELLSGYTEAQIKKLHGIGPSSLPVLRMILDEKGLSFKN